MFLDPEVTLEQRSGIEAAITDHPHAVAFDYVDRAESVAEWKRLFADQPQMLDWAEENPNKIPTSYRITTHPEVADQLAAVFEDRPGVRGVSIPGKELREQLRKLREALERRA